MPSSLTGIDFRNDIKEDENYNILTYEYLYNGGGVAVGDVNGDGLADIMFTGNMTSNKLYLNKGNFKFQDITGKAGVTGRTKWKTGVVMADVNGDGLLDIYVCYSGPGTDSERANELYINNGTKNGVPTFTESAKKYGLDAIGTYTTTVAFFDMDNDGDLDMFMVNHGDMFYNPYYNTSALRSTRNAKFGNRLYRNDNGHFTDVSEQAHIDGSGLNFGLSVSISDMNNDGWADIYVTNDYDERDFLYLNNRNGTFREVLTQATGHISEFSMGSDIADYNNDGRSDIMVLDMLPEDNHRQKLLRGASAYDKYTMLVDYGFHHQQMRNTLQLNMGNDSGNVPIFSEIGQLAGVSNTDWSWSPLFADFDNDGWKDLFISNGILRDMTNLDFVKYTSGYAAEYTKKTGSKAEMWKLVKDMPSTKLTNYLFKNNHQLGFTNVTADWGLTKPAVSNGTAYADLDNDGDLDLIVNNLNGEATIYRNNTSENSSAHFIRIKLKGDKKNTFGIGAKISVKTTTCEQFQEQYPCRGFQSSVDPVMHIGLGKDSVIESLLVIWPDGKVSSMKNVKADTLVAIDETDALVGDRIMPGAGHDSLFEDVTTRSGINYVDYPSGFVDFKISPLLPYQISKTGPCIAKADVNGDGLEDLFVGSSAGQQSQLYLQLKDGRFVLAREQPWNANKSFDNTDALFFDA
ncbi:MAG: CRTAC1 family protein, partial [Bacteroidota bacterium]|nr:CRTAC1 family protein [Bacteroidota bacterium]